MDLPSAIIASFITIFAIMDPFASIPPFLALTKDCKDKELVNVANKSVLIAGLLAAVFTVAGPPLLNALSITLSDFKIAGGIVLVLMGLENVMNLSFSNGHDKKKEGLDSAAVLIATPLLTGPGLMTSLVIMDKEYTLLPVMVSLFAALLISWLLLRNAGRARQIVGEKVIMIFSKVMGLFLIATGIAFIRAGFMGL